VKNAGMNTRTIAIAALAAAAIGGGTALAATAGTTATVTASVSTEYKVNQYVKETAKWSPGALAIKSGGTLTIRNKGGAPHTFSIVKASQVPTTNKQIERCGAPKTPCGDLVVAHEDDPESDAPPKKPLVDVGATGFDQPGDSVFFAGPKGTKVKITAKKGTTLRFMCAIHPWMSGKISVK
jgi:plastocyanin